MLRCCGDRAYLADDVSWPIAGALKGREDGSYTVGIRPHHVTPAASSADGIRIDGRVLVAELSGSESIIHFSLYDRPWVSQSHGVHQFKVGDVAPLFIDSRQCLYFDRDERLVDGA